MKRISNRQKEVFEFIKNEEETKGKVPPYTVIGEHFGISKQAVHQCLEKLCKRGLIKLPGPLKHHGKIEFIK